MKLILFISLLLLIIDKCHNDSLNKSQDSELGPNIDINKFKKSKRKLETCEDWFKNDNYLSPLNIYIDELCMEEELKEDLQNYIGIIKNSMNNAAKALKKILKIYSAFGNPYYSEDVEVKDDLGVNVFNNTLIGSKAGIKGMTGAGVHYIVMTKVASRNTMGEKIASSKIIFNDGECGQPLIGMVTLNPDIDYSQFTTSYLDYIMVHQFTHLLGFHKTFINKNPENIDFISPIKEDASHPGHYYVDSENVINFAKKYFDCNSITKIDIEMDGDSPHWPSRILLGEYMTGLKYPEEQVISGFTLSYFEDLKYLRVENILSFYYPCINTFREKHIIPNEKIAKIIININQIENRNIEKNKNIYEQKENEEYYKIDDKNYNIS
jgi:hypothetical protein